MSEKEGFSCCIRLPLMVECGAGTGFLDGKWYGLAGRTSTMAAAGLALVKMEDRRLATRLFKYRSGR